MYSHEIDNYLLLLWKVIMRSLSSMACCSSPLRVMSELRVGRVSSCSSASCLYTSMRKVGAERLRGGTRARCGRSPKPKSSKISCSTTNFSCGVMIWCITVWSTPLSMYNPEKAASAITVNTTMHAHRHAAFETAMFTIAAPTRLARRDKPRDAVGGGARRDHPLNLPTQGGPLAAHIPPSLSIRFQT